MSRNKLLSLLGLFVRPMFLPPAQCVQLSDLMKTAPSEPAEVYVSSSGTAVDEHLRRALSVSLPASTCAAVEGALDDLRGDLERHFGVPLTTREPPHYLVYGAGAFFGPHRDRPLASREVEVTEVFDRQVSVIVFLSAPRSLESEGYAGGDLNFYGLLDGPGWETAGFGCDAEPGLLLAFRTDTLHEVTPVTAGYRCTIVTWFG